MPRPARMLWICLGLPGAMALAQANGVKVRLDEGAAPPQRGPIAVEQIVPVAAGRTRDGPGAAPGVTGQPSGRAGREQAATTQVQGARPRDATPLAPLSSRQDSRPAPPAPLGGADRCDSDGHGKAAPGVCRQVIEQRAAEFPVPRHAPVSAEAILLGLDRTAATLADVQRGDSKLRTAGQTTNPDDTINQVASTVATAARSLSDPPRESTDKAVSDALDAVMVQIQGAKQ